jgi:hypothetical protein
MTSVPQAPGFYQGRFKKELLLNGFNGIKFADLVMIRV